MEASLFGIADADSKDDVAALTVRHGCCVRDLTEDDWQKKFVVVHARHAQSLKHTQLVTGVEFETRGGEI